MQRSYPIPKREAYLLTRDLFIREDDGTDDCDRTCPQCPEGQSCLQTTPSEFGECPQMFCGDSLNINTEEEDDGPSIGAIVGAIVGGLVLTAAVTYLVWRFCIKPKRKQQYFDAPKYEDTNDTTSSAEAEKQFAQRRDQRSSTHTVHSIASTVLTRASNIIQIAYIPGVTNRATPTSPTVLVPPVPPIPLALSNANSPSPYEEPHFFVPGDLRDSTYSGYSAFTDRTSMARTSYAARTSMAPSIASAVISPPPITGIRGKAAIVSLKSSGASSGSATPPVPSIDYEKYGRSADLKPPPSPGAASTFSVGSTFLSNAQASSASHVRPQIVRVTSKTHKVNPLNIVKAGSSSPMSPSSDSGHLQPVRSSNVTANTLGRDSAAVTIIDDTPVIDQGPFSDPPSSSHKSTTSLSAVIEEATKRAARTSTRTGESSRERSPFSDDHATND